MTNTVAYCGTELITAVKSFTKQVGMNLRPTSGYLGRLLNKGTQGTQYYKTFL